MPARKNSGNPLTIARRKRKFGVAPGEFSSRKCCKENNLTEQAGMKTTGRTMLLYLGVSAVAIGYDNILHSPWSFLLIITGAVLLYIRDNVSWGLTSDIVKLAYRIKLTSANLIWDDEERRIVAVVLADPPEEGGDDE